MTDTHFGEHLTIDGYGGDKKKLNSKKIVLFCLKDLVQKIGMKMLAKPQVYLASGNNIKDPGGWSGFVIIEESHVSIHTFPERRFVSIDIYTCKNGLDKDMIINYFKKAFDLEDTETNFIKRGTRYPANNLA